MSRRALGFRSAVRARQRRASGAGGAPAAAGIELVDVAITTDDAVVASLTANVPALVEDGQFMLMEVGIQNDVDLLSVPTGWTRIAAMFDTQVNDDLGSMMYFRRASSEPATYEVASNHAVSARQMQVIISVWSSVRADNFDVTPAAAHTTSRMNLLNPSNPAITSLTDGAVMVTFGVWGYTLLTGFGAQSGYTIAASDISQAVSAGMSYKTIDEAGLETPGPWTHTASVENQESITNSVLLKLQPAVVDDDFASVVLLLDFAGADGATDITDLSNSAHVPTFIAQAQVDTALTFLDQNSVLFDGVGDDLNFPDSADWDFGTGDFTIEFGVRWDTTVAQDGLISSSLTSVGWYVLGDATTLRFTNNDTILIQETHGIVADTWYHVAVCRNGTNLRIFVDGSQIGGTTTDSTTVNGGSGPLFIGALLDLSNNFTGNMGAVRITKGVARYTANFTAPTEFYPTQ